MAVGILIWICIFVAGLIVLLKSSDFFTGAAEKIGLKLGIPSFVVGVTIVAIGTSLPELISSIFAVTNGASEIVIGNVVGSNIANILLVLGVVAIVSKKIETHYEILKVDLPIFFASALYILITCFDGEFNYIEGIIGLIGVIVYLIYAASSAKKNDNKSKQKKELKGINKELIKEGISPQLLILLISGFFIFIGAKYTIDSVIQISEMLNIGKELIAISAVAIGTSLPELFVGYSAAKKGNAGMAFGNVLGSNIFNSFGVLGVASLFGVLTIPSSIIMFSLPVMIGASLLYFFMTQDKQLTLWEGAILLLLYVLYIGKIFTLF